MRVAFYFSLFVFLTSCAGRHVESISIKGSDTEVNLVLQLAEAYMETDPDVSVNVTGGGSGVGIAGLLNSRTDVANSSREINAYELSLAAERGVAVEPFVFAADALAIITEWSVFRTPSFQVMKELMKNEIIFDGRNLYDLEVMADHGFHYHSIGRETVGKKPV